MRVLTKPLDGKVVLACCAEYFRSDGELHFPLSGLHDQFMCLMVSCTFHFQVCMISQIFQSIVATAQDAEQFWDGS